MINWYVLFITAVPPLNFAAYANSAHPNILSSLTLPTPAIETVTHPATQLRLYMLFLLLSRWGLSTSFLNHAALPLLHDRIGSIPHGH
jgi:hypothetical protein